MPVLFANRAASLLASSIDDSATTLILTSGTEGRFPSPTGGDWFPVTVADAAGNVENMHCTARAGSILTVLRGQEGTAARAFDAGAAVESRVTAGALSSAIGDSSRLQTEMPDLVLPPRLQQTLPPSGNLNADLGTGFYYAETGTDNAPLSDPGFVWHLRIDADTRYQEYLLVGTQQRFVRQMVGGSFGAWEQPYLTRAEALALRLPGEIVAYGGPNAPAGWLFLFGQAVLRATYPDLDTAIYVGDAANATAPAGYRTTSTINPHNNRSPTGAYIVLPDGRGRSLIGRDNMGGIAAGRITSSASGIDGTLLGAGGGTQEITLTTAQMPEHTHPVSGSAASAGAHQHSGGAAIATGNIGNLPSTGGGTTTQYVTGTAGAHSHSVSGTASAAGGGQAHRNVQPSMVANWIMKT